MTGEFRRVLDADVGEAVRQQQAAVDALFHEVAGDLLAAAQPATAQVRATAGVDLDEAFHGGPAGFAGRGGGGDDDLDLVVVHDDAEAVRGLERADGLGDGALGGLELDARHRA